MLSTFRSFTGLDVKEFDSLYGEVESRYDEKERRADGGHPFKLSLRNRLLMLLVYYRLYVTSRLVSFLFDLDHSNVLRDMRMLEPVVREILPIPQKLHDRVKKASRPEEVEDYFPGFKAFIDATEQEIPRPKDKRKRKTHYSGKKRRHTVKTQLTVNKNGLIIHKTNHAHGRRHDYAIFKDSHPSLPKKVRPVVDLGYDGIQNDYPEMKPIIPFKRRGPGRGHRGANGSELTHSQKRFNKKLSRARVIVEHTISRVKKFRMMGEEFRNNLKRYDLMTDIVSGLVNLRILGTTATI